jgi:hypothetical protein
MAIFLGRASFIAIVLSFLLSPALTLAQSTEGLLLKPAIVEDNVVPGEVTQYSINVQNISAVDKTFFLTTQDIKGLDDVGLPVFAQEGELTGYELASWISLPSGAITLKAGETKPITFSVHVPNKTSPGAHFGAIFITNRPSQIDSTGSAVGISVASIVSLKIAGDVREEAQLREFSTEKIVYSDTNVDLISKIENMGNILIRPHGTINITDMFGRAVAAIEVNATGAPVFPNSTRKYTAKWMGDGFTFGRYQAVAAFSYGDTESKTISGTTSFWILPIKPIAILLGVLLLVIVGMYITIRLYIRRKLNDMGISSQSKDADYYARKYQRSGSRIIVITLSVFLLCVIFLSGIFLAFA